MKHNAFLSLLLLITVFSVSFLHLFAISFAQQQQEPECALYSWGQGYYNELGLNDIFSVDEPIPANHLPNTTLFSNGFVVLENGTMFQAVGGSRMVSLPAFAGKTIVKLQSFRDYITCVLTADSKVYCWGTISEYFNGIYPVGYKLATVNTPVLIDFFYGKPVKDISVGAAVHILFDDNTIFGWGYCTSYSVGVCSYTSFITTPTPLTSKLPSGKTWKKVVNAGETSFVLAESGELYGWGDNQYGTVGDNTTVNKQYAVQVIYPAAVSDISTGDRVAIALLVDGTVYVHGDNSYSRLLPQSSSPKILTPTKIELPAPATAVFTSAASSYALLSNGKLYNWNSGTPPYAMQIANVQRVVLPAPGTALIFCNDTSKYAVGSNSNGYFLLGYVPGDAREIVRSPERMSSAIDDGKEVKQINAGNLFGFVVKQNASIIGFGLNSQYQLGNSKSPSRQGKSIVDMTILAGQSIKSFVTGESHSLLLTEQGDVFGFGLNNNGQLGTGTTLNSGIWTPASLSNVVGKVKHVCAGYMFSALVDDQNNVYTMGSNTYYSLGNGGATSTVVKIPTKINSDGISSTITQVSCTYMHTLMLTSDSKIYAFGNNQGYSLGTNSQTQYPGIVLTTDTEYSTMISGKTIWKVYAGYGISFALEATGLVYVWGIRSDDPKMHYGKFPALHPEFNDMLAGTGVRPVDIAVTKYTILMVLNNGSLIESGTDYPTCTQVMMHFECTQPPPYTIIRQMPSDTYKYAKLVAGSYTATYTLFCKTLPDYNMTTSSNVVPASEPQDVPAASSSATPTPPPASLNSSAVTPQETKHPGFSASATTIRSTISQLSAVVLMVSLLLLAPV